MVFKITIYNNYFEQEVIKEKEVEYDSLDSLLDDYGITTDKQRVKNNLLSGLVVVYDEEGDKTFDPQFHSDFDMVFKIETIK